MAGDIHAKAQAGRSSAHDWTTPEKRVAWLLLNQFQGNRSAMGRATGLSHTAISKVASADKPPGRRFLTALTEKLKVDASWLLTGEGEPFSDFVTPSVAPWMPVSNKLFQEQMPEQLDDVTDDMILTPSFRHASQFWYRLRKGEALLAEPECGFLKGDLLLMETNPAHFPPEAHFFETLCAVRCRTNDGFLVRLGTVSHYEAREDDGPARLVFEPYSEDSELVEDLLIRRFSDGKTKTIRRKGYLYKERNSEKFVWPEYDNLIETAFKISRQDIVAVWTGQLLRYPYMTTPRSRARSG